MQKEKSVGCANNVFDLINIRLHEECYYFPAW